MSQLSDIQDHIDTLALRLSSEVEKYVERVATVVDPHTQTLLADEHAAVQEAVADLLAFNVSAVPSDDVVDALPLDVDSSSAAPSDDASAPDVKRGKGKKAKAVTEPADPTTDTTAASSTPTTSDELQSGTSDSTASETPSTPTDDDPALD